jgi:hypothetical protein
MGNIHHTGKPAAALVGIIVILIVFYILMLPEETRESLLDGKDITETTKEYPSKLIDKTIGKLSFIAEEKIDHYLQGSYLEEKQESVLLAEYDTFIISKGLFGGDATRKLLLIDNPEKLNKIYLTFQAPVRDGKLKITLNEQTIFESEILTPLPKPIELPKEYIQKKNELIFEAIGGFFKAKEYRIEDLKAIGETTDKTAATSYQAFNIAIAELENFKNAYLEFGTSCIQREVGNLIIELNGRKVSTTTPACGSTNKIEIFSTDLYPGKNEMIFTIEKGKLRIESAKIRVNLKEQKGFTDFFTITEKDWEKIQDNKKRIILDIEMIDDNIRKRAEININGRRSILDQRQPHYTKDITSYTKTGNNYVQILPLTEITIVNLEVRIEDK